MLKKIAKISVISLCTAVLITALPFQALAKLKNLSKSVKVGDTVYFGKYEQDGNTKNGKEKIEWQILDKKGNKALLISKKVLDIQPYHKEAEEITWEECSLRVWLNNKFIKEAFSSEEIKKIEHNEIENKNNEKYKTEGGKNTTDKVFLLSIDEAKKYFKTDEKRTAEITNYGIKRLEKVLKLSKNDVKEGWFGEDNNMWYWLRTSGHSKKSAVHVYDNGSLSVYGNDANYELGGIRPVILVHCHIHN